MLKELVEKITSLNENKIHEINGEFYTEKRLERVAPVINRPTPIKTYSLDSIVKLISSEIDAVKSRVFIQIEDVDEVVVFTSWDNMFVRSTLYTACFRGIEQSPAWRSHDAAMIELRSRYVQNEGSEYLLNILSRITDENSVTSRDNGITQEVEARRGVSLASKEVIKPRVKLIPYRTFSEVEQPESEFLVRLREGGEIGLFEADGGAWKLTARENIRKYFEENLKEFIENGSVVVMI
jgi:hypothetical protein